jgi:hypothetical protein
MKPRAVGSILRAGPLHQKTWSFQAGITLLGFVGESMNWPISATLLGEATAPKRCAQCWGMYRKESDDHQDEAAELSEKWNRMTDKERESMTSRRLWVSGQMHFRPTVFTKSKDGSPALPDCWRSQSKFSFRRHRPQKNTCNPDDETPAR